jgi:hypothetical protein
LNDEELNMFERALDASAIVALGKLVLFKLVWQDARFWVKPKNPSEKDLESIRSTIREVINRLSDDAFFVPPAVVGSAENVGEFLRRKLKEERLPQKVLVECEKLLRNNTSSLFEFTKDS